MAFTNPGGVDLNGTNSVVIVPANSGRKSLRIVNDSDVEVWIAEGAVAEKNKGVRLNAFGGTYPIEALTPKQRIFGGRIEGIADSGASKRVTVSEVDWGQDIV